MFDNTPIFRAFFSKKKPNKELEKLYDQYRDSFFAYTRRNFSVNDSVIKDIYQEAFIVVAENIRSGQLNLDNLKVSFKTYLFSIGKNKLYNYVRDNEKLVDIPDNLNEQEEISSNMDIELREIIEEEVGSLGEPCNRILSLFYFERESMKKIAGIMGYKTEQVAKNKRLFCVKILKEIILKKYRKEDLL